MYLEAHEPLSDDGETSIVDKHAAVVNVLLKRDDIAGSHLLDWQRVREIVAAEEGMPMSIAEQIESVQEDVVFVQ